MGKHMLKTRKSLSSLHPCLVLSLDKMLLIFVNLLGCVSQAAPNEPWLKEVSIIGVKNIDQVVNVVDETFKGNVVRLLSKNRVMPALNIPKMRRNEYIEILAINSGCLNTCTYCKTKQSRGKK